MDDVNTKFVDMANPYSWLVTADNLHEQAQHLYGRRGRLTYSRLDRHGVSKTWDGTNKSIFLIGGFALENAIKSFLVFENPQWVSNGALAKDLKSHSLTALQEKASLIPYKTKYIWVLKKFEDGIESWARYPCGLSVHTSFDEEILSPGLWDGYVRLINAYFSRMQRLLTKGWRGPHQYHGKWRIKDV
ncbi:hypothetical protein [Bradyrhizobium erythrophlei]|uniref:Uncharacterized protein n=1 Tax=Bradyrhizobium erythrophlei TaxID=1437360 RepID=A0A1M5MV32_9BRAD|nr:hypothetical protein [Bradyrhizobium erythrophlei]SHG81037.1 hypothetical protein SAMN05443248_2734 [Bradyrhizobium erythrophlei]